MNWRTVIGVSILALAAGESEAQGTAGSLDELVRSYRLERGDVVYVTDDSGKRVKGSVGSLSSDSLTLSNRWGTSMYDDAHIVKIERHDSPWSGFHLGFWGVMMMSAVLGVKFERPETALMYIGAVAGGAGLVGGVVDARMHETVYKRHRTRWSLDPVLTKRGAGARVSIGR